MARKNGAITGYIIESVAPDGYSGSIRLLTGVSTDAEIQRVEVLEHHETPGLGDKIERSKNSWIDRFNYQKLPAENDALWAVKMADNLIVLPVPPSLRGRLLNS